MSTPAQTQVVDPILRWAGGKRWLTPLLRRLIGERSFGSYHEPFLGGAAAFFGLDPVPAPTLSDSNDELIQTYRTVATQPVEVYQALREHMNTRDHYYQERARVAKDAVDKAARFIYLNHTSFNGIFRVNLAGQYNVPFGYRANPSFPTASHLETAAAKLSTAKLRSCDYQAALDAIPSDALIYLDPPYTVAHNTNGFVKYNQSLFSFDDQRILARRCRELAESGVTFIVSNAAHSSIRELYSDFSQITEVHRRNSVGGTRADRGRATEYLITNLTEK